jgi:hypothetical protein
MAYEDRQIFAAHRATMTDAVDAINRLDCADLLRQIVPGNPNNEGGYWLIFKRDSSVVEGWREVFPTAAVLPRS